MKEIAILAQDRQGMAQFIWLLATALSTPEADLFYGLSGERELEPASASVHVGRPNRTQQRQRIKPCCGANVAICKACAAGMEVLQYCRQHKETFGCSLVIEKLSRKRLSNSKDMP